MDGHERRKKLLLGGGLALLLGVGISCWRMDSELQATERPTVTRVDSGEKVGVNPIAGLEQATAQRDLRNPFSIVHETETDQPPVPAPLADPAGQSPVPPTAPAPAPAVPGASAAGTGHGQSLAPALPVQPVLCGLAQGGNGKLAMIRIGSQTITAGVGEWAGSWQIREITDSAVVLDSGEASERLLLMQR